MENPFTSSILENPSFWVFASCVGGLAMIGLVYLAAVYTWHGTWGGRSLNRDLGWTDEPYRFGFRRISPDGTRYQWWADYHWLEADEFLERCSGLGMSEQSVIDEFGYTAEPPKTLFP